MALVLTIVVRDVLYLVRRGPFLPYVMAGK